tara:strand:+ start:693 stop:1721 length:1029 start_codon:yes stop_codon:yes gene_type:complete
MYNKNWICEKCGYETNRKQNFETHIGRQVACEKRLKRLNNEPLCQNVNPSGQNVNPSGQNVNPYDITFFNNCKYCNKTLSSKRSLERHQKTCKGVHSLQCPTCKKTFTTREGKYKHMKNVKCELVLTEEQQRIKELEEELKEKNKQLEEERARPTTVYNNTTNNTTNTTNNTLNYFNDPNVNYNNYDNLDYGHITSDEVREMIEENPYFPEFIENLFREALIPKENQVMVLPEGHKSNRLIVYKDKKELSKLIMDVLMNCLVQTCKYVRNIAKKFYKEGYWNSSNAEQNEFFFNMRDACKAKMVLDINLQPDFMKESVMRLKNVLLDTMIEQIRNFQNVNVE